jgi:hypothetical protein
MAIGVFLCSMYLVDLPLAFFCIEAGSTAVVTEIEEVVDSDGQDVIAGTPCRPLR